MTACRGIARELTVERDELTVAQDKLLARASDLEQLVTAGEAASSAALAVLAERSAKLEQTERDLEENCPSSDDLRHFVGFREGGSGSLVVEVMLRLVGAASDDLRLSGV